MFYALTAWASLLEVALPLLAISWGYPLWYVGAIMSAYHFGYLLRDILVARQMKLWEALAVYIVSLVLLTVGGLLRIALLLLAGVVLTSTATQYLRNWLKHSSDFNPSSKSMWRLGGFIVGGLATEIPALIVALGMVSAALGVRRPLASKPLLKWPNLWKAFLHPLLVFEFFHHLQYFIYCYYLLVIVWQKLGPFRSVAGLLFVVGWIGYAVIYTQLKSFKPSAMICGHLACAAATALMATNPDLPTLLIAWFITGIGGGTAYGLDFVDSTIAAQIKPHREFSENLGHVLGPAVAALLVAAGDTTFVFGSSAIASLLAVCSLLWYLGALKQVRQRYSQ